MNISATIVSGRAFAVVGVAHKEYQYQHENILQVKADTKLSHAIIKNVRSDT